MIIMEKEISMPLVSVVIPIYNVENYLKECLQSVCEQTLKEIEIICVDDGSTDNSLAIVKEFQAGDSRIKCISKANSGYGNTMNVGFDAATGEYIGIVESDDYVDKHMFEELYQYAKTNDLDLVKSDYLTFDTANGKLKSNYVNTCQDTKYYYSILEHAHKDVFSFEMNTWTGIYKKDFIQLNKIRHNETPGASYQDNGFWFQTISLATKMMFVNKAFYYYRQDNPNSSINSKSKIFCICEEYAFIKQFIVDHKDLDEEIVQSFFVKKYFNYLHTYKRIAKEYRLTFLQRFSEEFEKSIETKEIDISKLDSWVSKMIFRIVDDYERFYYEDQQYILHNKLDRAMERLWQVKNSIELRRGEAITSRLKKLFRERVEVK